MKTTPILLAVSFILQINILTAGNPVKKDNSNSNKAVSFLLNLAPETPSSADFSEVIPELNNSWNALIPVTPSEAGFDENLPEMKVDRINLNPETPSVADFDDENTDQVITISLIPSVPAEADFE